MTSSRLASNQSNRGRSFRGSGSLQGEDPGQASPLAIEVDPRLQAVFIGFEPEVPAISTASLPGCLQSVQAPQSFGVEGAAHLPSLADEPSGGRCFGVGVGHLVGDAIAAELAAEPRHQSALQVLPRRHGLGCQVTRWRLPTVVTDEQRQGVTFHLVEDAAGCVFARIVENRLHLPRMKLAQVLP